MKLIIDVDKKLVCEGFERTFTEEERDILIRAIGNGISVSTEGDLISRSALKKVFENLASDDYYVPIWYQQTVFEKIDNAPTVKVPENEVNCVLTMFGECSYNKTGCSDCEIKMKIFKALKNETQKDDDLCETCKYGDICGQSDKGVSFAKHSKCWKYNVSYLHQDSITKTDTKI